MTRRRIPFFMNRGAGASYFPVGEAEGALSGVDDSDSTGYRGRIFVPAEEGASPVFELIQGGFNTYTVDLGFDVSLMEGPATLVIRARASNTAGVAWPYMNLEFPYLDGWVVLDWTVSSTYTTFSQSIDLELFRSLIDTQVGFITHTQTPFYAGGVILGPPGDYYLDVSEAYVEVEIPDAEMPEKPPITGRELDVMRSFVAGRQV